MIYTCLIDTPLGTVRAAGTQGSLTGLWFTGQKHFPDASRWKESKDYPLFKKLDKWLGLYFSGENAPFDFELNPNGTDFRKKIWNKLLSVSWGNTVSYQELYLASARAAGNAVGHNPISIIIPCHRVIGSNGSLTGYAGGLERKKALLQLEGICL